MKFEGSALETQTFYSAFNNPQTHESDENRDLGFGSEVARRSRKRLLNRDGSFNVSRIGRSFVHSRSLYQYLITVSWRRFLLYTFAAYLSANFVFALLYFLCGPLALNGVQATSALQRLGECFFFSVHTLATIGYGSISPASLPAHAIVTIEALTGLLGIALATGLFFARIARPSAKVIFSRFAIIAPYKGGAAFEFRIVNERANQLFHVEVRVVLSRMERDGAALKRRFYELALERKQVMFFPLNWTIVHPIDKDSPLSGVTDRELAATDAEFLVMLQGIDDTFSQTVYTWSSYKYDEIIWGARFTNIIEEMHDGTVQIDLRRVHQFELTELPRSAA